MRCGRAGDGNLAESCHLRHPCELRLPYLGNAQTVTVCQSRSGEMNRRSDRETVGQKR